MSKVNASNRPQVQVAVSTAASKKIPVLHAHKKLLVHEAKYLTVGAIAASGSAYSAQKLQKSAAGVAPADIEGATAVDTQTGVAAYGQKVLTVPAKGILLEKGETLYLDHALTGSLTLDGQLSVDYEVIGN